MKNNIFSDRYKYKYTIIGLILCLIVFVIVHISYINSEKIVKNIITNTTKIEITTSTKNTPPKTDKISTKNKPNIIVNNNNFYTKLLKKGEIGLGESYVDKDWDSDDLEETLYNLIINQKKIENNIIKYSPYLIIKKLLDIPYDIFSTNNAKNNIKFHYDIGNQLYQNMLGESMLYSCAYYYKPGLSLDQAQYAKLDLIAKKLNLKPGMSVLDMGCGFGTAAIYLSKKFNVNILGISLSKEQISYFNSIYNGTQVKVLYKDYRELTQEHNNKYDCIYSIGIFEHIGINNQKDYYNKCSKLLKTNGTMLIHTIVSNKRLYSHNSWITKYIFPGAELPHISDFTKKYADDWLLQDLQCIGKSYSKTLLAWKKNINNSNIFKNYDDKFKRTWNYYLLLCSAAFRSRTITVFQLVYFKKDTQINDDPYYIREQY